MSSLGLFLLIMLFKNGKCTCRLQGTSQKPELAQHGDFVIGGLFSFRTGQDYVSNTFQTIPLLRKCNNFNFREFKFAQTMIFAIKEINEDPEMLSGVKLGYKIYDNCGTMDLLRAALGLVSGSQEKVSDDNCTKVETVQAILGHSGSSPTIPIAQVVGRFQIPVISHFATCACLSNKREYPSFFRTIPSDYHQSKALAKLVKHLGWKWVGTVAVDNEYGLNGMASFIRAAQEYEVCTEYSEAFSSSNPPDVLQKVVRRIKQSTSKVIVAFMSHREIRLLASELWKEKVAGLQWIGSDAWITDPSLTDSEGHTILVGSLGFTVAKAQIPGLEEYLRQLHPSQFPESQFIKDFWEETFHCTLNESQKNTQKRLCNGSESLENVKTQFTDMSEIRFTHNVYKSVYSVAHALNNLCKRNERLENCSDLLNVRPWQVLQHLRDVNFSSVDGGKVYFDSNGDSPARYELVNLQLTIRGTMEGETVGMYDASLPDHSQFILNNVPIVWGTGLNEVPVSVCSKECLPGTYRVLKKGKPVCCHDCIRCPAGEISNQKDSTQCVTCQPQFWSNLNRDSCIPKPIEFLAFDEILGSLLTMFSLLGFFLTVIIVLVFFQHKDTPLVRANNSELSFLLLFSLSLCFLCSLTFIGRPSKWSCMLRHTAFGISFVLCISCIMGKTIVVLIAFRATLPGSNIMKWFGPLQQRLSVLGFSFIQILICILWLTIKPPFPYMNYLLYNNKIILQCHLGTAVGFCAVLGYIGVLSMLCFLLAFMARKLPDNFNEAKFITFSMLIFCAVWVAFIPAYISSPGKFSDAVEVFAILASTYGLLFCIFLPKCYIILCRPEQNNKKHLMGKSTRS